MCYDIIPSHLHDLQEADLRETQRGLVMNEIAQFCERTAKHERVKMCDVCGATPSIITSTVGATAPAGPNVREWGKPQLQSTPDTGGARGFSQGLQGYGKPVGFARAEEGRQTPGSDRQTSVHPGKADEELEQERKEVRRRDEEDSYKTVSCGVICYI